MNFYKKQIRAFWSYLKRWNFLNFQQGAKTNRAMCQIQFDTFFSLYMCDPSLKKNLNEYSELYCMTKYWSQFVQLLLKSTDSFFES